jgi:hypothetical protein
MKSLQGITLEESERVQNSFILLYTVLFDAMDMHSKLDTTQQKNSNNTNDDSLHELIGSDDDSGSTELVSTVLWCWCLDFQPCDLEFLLRIGLQTMLENRISERTSTTVAKRRRISMQDLERNRLSMITLYRWTLLCSIGGRNGFYNGCGSRGRMMRAAIREKSLAQRSDLVDPAVRFRSAIVDGEEVRSLPGVLIEAENGADECLKISLFVQSRLMNLLQEECARSALACFTRTAEGDRVKTNHEEEESLYGHLTFLLSIIVDPACQMHLKPSFFRDVVFVLYGTCSPRITRSIHHLLSVLLVSRIISTRELMTAWEDSENTAATMTKSISAAKRKFIQKRMERIGRSLAWKMNEFGAELAMSTATATATEMARAVGRGIGLTHYEQATANKQDQQTSSTAGPPPAPPAPQASSSVTLPVPENEFLIPEESLEQVCAMGFPENHAKIALKKYNLDIMQAVTWLLNSPNELMTAEEEAKIAEHQSMSLPETLNTGDTSGGDDIGRMEAKEEEELISPETIFAKMSVSTAAFESVRESNSRKAQTDLGYGVGIAHAAEVDNEIMLIRTLASNSSWDTIVKDVLRETLHASAEVTVTSATATASTTTNHHLLLATFSILGGHVESVRVGGRVRVVGATGANEGIVLSSEVSAGDISVLFDGAIELDIVEGKNTFCSETVSFPSNILQLDEQMCAVYASYLFDESQCDVMEIEPSNDARSLEKEERDLLRSPSTGSNDNRDSVSSSGNDDPLDITFLTDDIVNSSMIRTACSRSFMFMVRNAESAAIAVSTGMLPRLLHVAATPVTTLADTVALFFLEVRHAQLRFTVHEITTGCILALDASPTVSTGCISMLTEKEKKRHAAAEQLMAMCIHPSQEKDLYLFGLEENGDDLNRCLDWFMSGAADAALQ